MFNNILNYMFIAKIILKLSFRVIEEPKIENNIWRKGLKTFQLFPYLCWGNKELDRKEKIFFVCLFNRQMKSGRMWGQLGH